MFLLHSCSVLPLPPPIKSPGMKALEDELNGWLEYLEEFGSGTCNHDHRIPVLFCESAPLLKSNPEPLSLLFPCHMLASCLSVSVYMCVCASLPLSLPLSLSLSLPHLCLHVSAR